MMNKGNISYNILLLGIIAIPFDIVWEISVVRITISEIILSFGILFAFIDLTKYPGKLIHKKFLMSVLAFFGVCAISIVEAQNKWVAIRETFQFGWMLGLFLYVMNESRKRVLCYPVVTILILSSALVSLVGIYQYFFIREPIDFLINEARLRAHGFYSHPNTLGGFLSGIIPLLFGLYIISPSGVQSHKIDDERIRLSFLKKGVILSLLFIVSASVFATYSRASWIGILGGIIFLSSFLRKEISVKQYFLPIGILVLLNVLFFLDISYLSYKSVKYDNDQISIQAEDSTLKSFIFSRNFSNSQRIMIIGTTISMIHDYPICGVGLGNFRSRFPEYASPELIKLMQVDFNDSTRKWFFNKSKPIDVELVHNMFLQIIVETGIIGIAAFLWVLFMFYLEAIRRMLAAKYLEDRVLRAAMIASISAILIGGIFGWPFSHGIQEVMIINMALSVSRWS